MSNYLNISHRRHYCNSYRTGDEGWGAYIRFIYSYVPNLTCLVSVFYYVSPSKRKLNGLSYSSHVVIWYFRKIYLDERSTFFKDLLARIISEPQITWCYRFSCPTDSYFLYVLINVCRKSYIKALGRSPVTKLSYKASCNSHLAGRLE